MLSDFSTVETPSERESTFNDKVNLTLGVEVVPGNHGSAAQKKGVLPQWSQSLFALIFSNHQITVTSA